MDTLSSWKEIAQYLGKGVRTVQRWEQQMGLPVRRPQGHVKGTVFAFGHELDQWLRSFNATDSELERLRHEVAELKKQNEQLRARLERAKRAAALFPSNGSAKGVEIFDERFWKQCTRAVERSITLRLACAEVIDMARNMQMMRRMQREQDSFASTNSIAIH